MVINGENVNTAFPHSNWVDIPSTNAGGREPLVTAYLNITSGTHTIGTIREDTSFMCIIYGAGDRESYAYMGGMRLQVCLYEANKTAISHLCQLTRLTFCGRNMKAPLASSGVIGEFCK